MRRPPRRRRRSRTTSAAARRRGARRIRRCACAASIAFAAPTRDRAVRSAHALWMFVSDLSPRWCRCSRSRCCRWRRRATCRSRARRPCSSCSASAARRSARRRLLPTTLQTLGIAAAAAPPASWSESLRADSVSAVRALRQMRNDTMAITMTMIAPPNTSRSIRARSPSNCSAALPSKYPAPTQHPLQTRAPIAFSSDEERQRHARRADDGRARRAQPVHEAHGEDRGGGMAFDHAAHAVGRGRVSRIARQQIRAVVAAEQEKPQIAQGAARGAYGDDDRQRKLAAMRAQGRTG